MPFIIVSLSKYGVTFLFKLKFLFIVAGERLCILRHARRTAGWALVGRRLLLLSDNGGSTINSDGMWPGGHWVARVCEYVCVCVLGWLTKELEELEDSVCVNAALNYTSNHQSACQQNRTRGARTLAQPVQNQHNISPERLYNTHTHTRCGSLTHNHTRSTQLCRPFRGNTT